MSFIGFTIGALAAAALVFVAHRQGIIRERAFYVALLICIAFFYPVFAYERFALDEAVVQVFVACAFTTLAFWGYKAGGTVLAYAFVAHAVYDVVAGAIGLHAPMLWPEICLSFDLIMAYAARRWVV